MCTQGTSANLAISSWSKVFFLRTPKIPVDKKLINSQNWSGTINALFITHSTIGSAILNPLNAQFHTIFTLKIVSIIILRMLKIILSIFLSMTFGGPLRTIWASLWWPMACLMLWATARGSKLFDFR